MIIFFTVHILKKLVSRYLDELPNIEIVLILFLLALDLDRCSTMCSPVCLEY